jgi:hypothetical protein
VGHRGNGVTWQAPGRVNLIGEHTDYNAGYVLPFAIEQACAATVERLDECTLVIRSAQRADQAHLPYDRLQPGAAVGWAGYAAGVVWAMRQRGADLPGMRIAVDSTVPPGAGLSSSAALTCAGATAVVQRMRPVTEWRCTAPAAVALAREIGPGLSNPQLAAALNTAGHTTGAGKPFDTAACNLRYAYRIGSPDLLTVGELTQRGQAAHFLGYEIRAQHSDTKITRHLRAINAAMGLFVPKTVIRQRRALYLHNEKPAQRGSPLHDDDFTIVAKYGAEYAGLVQYYLLAQDVFRLGRLRGIMETSMRKTLAGKHRSRVAKMALDVTSPRLSHRPGRGRSSRSPSRVNEEGNHWSPASAGSRSGEHARPSSPTSGRSWPVPGETS